MWTKLDKPCLAEQGRLSGVSPLFEQARHPAGACVMPPRGQADRSNARTHSGRQNQGSGLRGTTSELLSLSNQVGPRADWIDIHDFLAWRASRSPRVDEGAGVAQTIDRLVGDLCLSLPSSSLVSPSGTGTLVHEFSFG